MPGYYIWINGFPGVGKLTVATALHGLLSGSSLIDNHSLIDQVKLPRDHPDYNKERVRVRDAMYASVVHPATDIDSACGSREEQMAQVLIFTDCFTRGETGSEWSQWHQVAAAKANRPFLPIYLACEREENLKRVVRPQRREAGSKLVDADMVAGFLDRLEIFKFPGGLGVDIDTTELAPEETAKRILEAMKAHQEQTVPNGGA